MPVVQLDAEARAMLEGYSWPGNVRQLKNVAEQISAVEQVRMIGPAILRRYLPPESAAPGAVAFAPGRDPNHGPGQSFGDEREILYRILFDMRADIADMRRTLDELRRRSEELSPSRDSSTSFGDGRRPVDEYFSSLVIRNL
jgi:DNA-binding NtrC family response regulator